MLIDRLRTLAEHGIGFDTETYKIRADLPVPPLVLGSVSWFDANVGDVKGALLTKDQVCEMFAQLAEDMDKVIIGANLAYDLSVLIKEFAKRGVDLVPYVFKMLMGEHEEHMTGIHDGRVFDIQHAEMLNAIATGNLNKDPKTLAPIKGRYSQDTCIKLLFDRDDAKKNDMYRLRYGEFDNWPLENLPPEAQQYPVDDTNFALEAGLAQVGVLPKVAVRHVFLEGKCIQCGSTNMGSNCMVKAMHYNLHDLAAQTATAFCLSMNANIGFQIDQKYVDFIDAHATKNYDENVKPYQEAKLVREDGTEDRSLLKKRMALAYGSKGDCPTCNGTGKVPSPKNPKSKIICFQLASDGETKLKTCDGTGLVLNPDVPRSEKDGIAYGRSNLTESGDDFLMGYASLQEDQKIRSVYCKFLREARVCISCGHTGIDDPGKRSHDPHDEGCVMAGWKDIPLTLSPNPILDTKRVSYNGAFQLLPRKPGYIDNISKEYIPSIRECFVARPGYILSSEDFNAGEMFTHAQSCMWLLGYSELGASLLKGVDPHGAIAATTLGVSYDEFVKRKKEPRFKAMRQAAKPVVFGRPTGMSPIKIVISSRTQGPDTPTPAGPSWIDDPDNFGEKIRGYKGLRFCILMNNVETCGDIKVTTWGKKPRKIPPTCKACLECGEHIANVWLRQFAENDPYYKYNQGIVESGMEITEQMLNRWPWLKAVYRPGMRTSPAQVMQHWSGTLRDVSNGQEFTTICNGWFQVLLADIAKLAYRMVCRESYDRTVKVPRQMFPNSRISAYAGGPSPLLGSHPVGFLHDEILAEHPESMAHDGATRISEIMGDAFRWACPDMAEGVGAAPTIVGFRWYKGAEEVRDENGRLVMWRPKIGPDALVTCA